MSPTVLLVLMFTPYTGLVIWASRARARGWDRRDRMPRAKVRA